MEQKGPKRKGKGKKHGRNAGQLSQPPPSATTVISAEAFRPDNLQAILPLATADIESASPPDGQQPNLPTPRRAAGITAAADAVPVASNDLESNIHAHITATNKPVRHNTANKSQPASQDFVGLTRNARSLEATGTASAAAVMPAARLGVGRFGCCPSGGDADSMSASGKRQSSLRVQCLTGRYDWAVMDHI
ncbi:TPA: hypothetical protein ACH3X2_003538 [Trebouxia sp. C0005]